MTLWSIARSPLFFGGDVTHAGLPVTSGTRHLFVMSFTLRPGRTVEPVVAPPEEAFVDSGDDISVRDGNFSDAGTEITDPMDLQPHPPAEDDTPTCLAQRMTIVSSKS